MVALPCVTGAGPTGGFCKSQLHDQQRVIACTESSVRTEESWEGKIRTHPDHRWDKFAHFKELSSPNHEHIPCTQLKVNRRPCPGVPPDPFLPRDGTTASWAGFTGFFAPHSVICWYPLHRHWPTGLSLEHQEGLALHIRQKAICLSSHNQPWGTFVSKNGCLPPDYYTGWTRPYVYCTHPPTHHSTH